MRNSCKFVHDWHEKLPAFASKNTSNLQAKIPAIAGKNTRHCRQKIPAIASKNTCNCRRKYPNLLAIYPQLQSKIPAVAGKIFTIVGNTATTPCVKTMVIYSMQLFRPSLKKSTAFQSLEEQPVAILRR